MHGLVVAKAAEARDPHVRVGATRVLEVAAAVESEGFSPEKQERTVGAFGCGFHVAQALRRRFGVEFLGVG